MSPKRKKEGSFVNVLAVSVALHLAALLILGGVTIFKMLSESGDADFVAPPMEAEALDKKQYQVRMKKSQRSSASPAPTPIIMTPTDVAVPRIVVEMVKPTKAGIKGRGKRKGVGLGGGDGSGLGGPPTFLPNIPQVLMGRCDPVERARRLRASGGELKSEQAVVKSLRWLKSTQKKDGSWGEVYPVSMTAFALLAYLGHCETPDSPEFGETVKNAINYLVKRSRAGDGILSSVNSLAGNPSAYEHGIAVYALAEAYALTKDCENKTLTITSSLSKGAKIIVQGQTNVGGWLYGFAQKDDGDLSVAGWQIQALKATQRADKTVGGLKTALKKAERYLEKIEDDQGNFKYRMGDAAGKFTLCGAGTLCLQVLGSAPKNEAAAFDAMIKNRPTGYPGNLYSWYYQTQACFNKGGQVWRKWNDTFQDAIVDAQQEDGSWAAGGGHAGGLRQDAAHYSTCLCTLMLEVYYRYLETGAEG